jgi:hypothetical protein
MKRTNHVLSSGTLALFLVIVIIIAGCVHKEIYINTSDTEIMRKVGLILIPKNEKAEIIDIANVRKYILGKTPSHRYEFYDRPLQRFVDGIGAEIATAIKLRKSIGGSITDVNNALTGFDGVKNFSKTFMTQIEKNRAEYIFPEITVLEKKQDLEMTKLDAVVEISYLYGIGSDPTGQNIKAAVLTDTKITRPSDGKILMDTRGLITTHASKLNSKLDDFAADSGALFKTDYQEAIKQQADMLARTISRGSVKPPDSALAPQDPKSSQGQENEDEKADVKNAAEEKGE